MKTALHNKTYDLFISYADADSAWVKGYLMYALQRANIRYHSEAAFTLGKPKIIEFEDAIQKSDRTLLVISPAYLADDFNQFVDLLTQYHGLETGTWPVIPLILEPTRLPPRLNILVKLDATNPEKRKEAIAHLCLNLTGSLPATPSTPACPYPGMKAFTEKLSHCFFGRDDEIQEMLERLHAHPFITAIGPSGSGKSSLVLAGLIPALENNTLFNCDKWLIEKMRPGETPLTTLLNKLGNNINNSATSVIETILTASGAQRFLLVVDQLEELFTLATEEAIPFQQALLRLAEAPQCYVILTVRADFYPELMESLVWNKIKTSRIEILPLSELGLAIMEVLCVLSSVRIIKYLLLLAMIKLLKFGVQMAVYYRHFKDMKILFLT